MAKKITLFFIFLISIFLAGTIYISTIGIETNSFNNLIKNKLKDYNKNIELDFDKAKLLLDIKSFNLKIKLIKPIIKSEKKEIKFSKIDSIISLKSYLNNEFALKNIKLKIEKVETAKLIDFARAIYPSPFIFILKNTIKKGQIECETELFFNTKGKLIENYEFTGSILNLEAKILKNSQINNINFIIKKDIFEFIIKDTRLLGLYFDFANIIVKKNKKDLHFSIASNNLDKINNFKKFLNNLNYKNFENNNFSNFDLSTNSNISFKLKRFTKLKDLTARGNAKIENFSINVSDLEKYKKYITINQTINLKDNKIKYEYNDNKLRLNTSGKINLNNKFENYNSNILFNYKDNSKNFNTEIELNSLNIDLDNFNYSKKIDKKANLNFNIFFNKKSKIIKKLKYEESKNYILINNLNFNNQNQIYDIEDISVKTFKNNTLNNDFQINKKNKKIFVTGKKYDANYFFKTLNKDNDSKIFSKKFNGDLTFKLKKIISQNEPIHDFEGSGKISFGKFHQLKAKAKFSKNEFLDISIGTISSNKKKLYIYSDRARPFVNNFSFIKGFREGKLEYISIYDDKASESNLKIYDFKIKKIPILAKLLSLASLQGIADLLTGEGIRFSELDLDFKSENKLLTIDEMYAIGPAISILMSGYIEKNNLVSLRGTLVPATTINKAIGSIPLLGKILVGRKVGEGVFGVSFKIKGPPKKLKTTVNPIKTLTPRFITRTLEKIKKN